MDCREEEEGRRIGTRDREEEEGGRTIGEYYEAVTTLIFKKWIAWH